MRIDTRKAIDRDRAVSWYGKENVVFVGCGSWRVVVRPNNWSTGRFGRFMSSREYRERTA